MKLCTKCGATKPGTAFGHHKATKDGLCSWCKACHRAATVAWKLANPEYAERRRALTAAKYAASPEVRAKCNARSRRDYHEKYKHNAEYMANARAVKQNYRAANKDIHAACTADYRQRKRGASGGPTELDLLVLREVYALARQRSALTGISWHVDHTVPLRGRAVCGLHNAFNLQCIPATVNLAKSNTAYY